jgi:hypothetical protein
MKVTVLAESSSFYYPFFVSLYAPWQSTDIIQVVVTPLSPFQPIFYLGFTFPSFPFTFTSESWAMNQQCLQTFLEK